MVASARAMRGRSDTSHRSAKALLLFVFAALGISLFFGLGVWQLERRAWKLDLIERVNERVHAAPVPAPGPASWSSVNAANDEYRHVSVTGQFLAGGDTLVKAVTEYGSGYWVLSPFRTGDGFDVLVNRGFIPEEKAKTFSAAKRGTGTVTGLLRLSEPGGAFLRSNDPSAGRWYSRDTAAIAAARAIGDVAPYFIDADASPAPEGAPVGGLTVISFPNNHLVYALTWFGLAAMLIGWLFRVFRMERKERD